MNFYNFSSHVNWSKILLTVVFLITGCALEVIPQPSIDPIPEGCPNNLEPKQEDRFCTEGDVCHFDDSGQISADRNESTYQCYQGRLRFVPPFIDPGTLGRPVYE